jgi:hypothetical protein
MQIFTRTENRGRFVSNDKMIDQDPLQLNFAWIFTLKFWKVLIEFLDTDIRKGNDI